MRLELAMSIIAATSSFAVRPANGVVVDFQNDHQPDFQDVAPKSAGDCDRPVIKRLATYLRKRTGDD